VEDFEQAQTHGDAAVKPPDQDPGEVAMAAATARLNRARDQVDEAAEHAARTLRTAAQSAPEKPAVLDRLMGWGKSFGEGFGEAGLDLLKMGIKTDLFYALVDPEGFLKQTTTTVSSSRSRRPLVHDGNFAGARQPWRAADCWAKCVRSARSSFVSGSVVNLRSLPSTGEAS
jgi:hypothetical protein